MNGTFVVAALLTLGSGGPVLNYLVLGDSTAAGVGASYEQGIAVTTARNLAQGRTIAMTNLAVSGGRTRDVLVEQLPRAAALRPDIALISVGANDVTHLTSIRSMRANLVKVVQALRKLNPAVAIVITGSPDMGAPPRIPRLLRGITSCRTKQVNRMFREEAERQHLVFAPIAEKTGPLFRADHSLFDTDRFHPNARGYATWVAVLDAALAEAVR